MKRDDDLDDIEVRAEDYKHAVIGVPNMAHLDAAMRKFRGPQKAPRKVAINLRVNPDVLATYKGTGRGWQGRMNEDLEKAAKRRAKLVEL